MTVDPAGDPTRATVTLDRPDRRKAVIAAVAHHGHEFRDFCLGLHAETADISREQKLALRCVQI